MGRRSQWSRIADDGRLGRTSDTGSQINNLDFVAGLPVVTDRWFATKPTTERDNGPEKVKNSPRSQRVTRLGALLLLLVLPASASARVGHKEAWARERFAAAERMRQALNARPASERTRHDYQRVIDAYRRVYYGSPTSTKADPSVVATAELMVEMGRRFHDDKTLDSAINQYRFLRREYPGSKDRFGALFAIGQIYKNDLDNAEQARSTFQEFLKRYPRHPLADDAKAAIAQLDQAVQAAAKPEPPQKDRTNNSAKGPNAAKDVGGEAGENLTATSKMGKMARVTGIRHWATPDYTRVAIDLDEEVRFDSQRIEHPDRVFFDLRDTQLASTLVGKSFAVEDGFLKKIRVAQFEPTRTRVVLEVDDLSQYNAFLLPNPYRLIIDIHGKQSAKAEAKQEAADQASGAAARKRDLKLEEAEMLDAGPRRRNTKDIQRLGQAADLEGPPDTKLSQPVAASKSVVKRVIEADDDDKGQAEDEQVVPSAQPVSKSTGRSKQASPKIEDRISRLASHTHGKIKAADGNEDEVATLDPTDIRPEPKSALAALRLPTPETKLSRKGKRGERRTPEQLQVREAQPTASGDRSLIRALGLKIGKIVIDPGHGGHDTGTIGPNGLEEKELVLDVSRRLGKLLQGRLGADVVYTRKDDTFIPLETRTAVANQEQADLFVSIHANSSRDSDARGVETYYLNFTTNATALEVAARENAVSDKSIHELQDLVKKIALKEKIEESREFASDVQRSLHSGLALRQPGIRDRGVKKAPFIVLIGANMPSILAEISFVSNPADERKLETPEYRQRIAESLYKGIAKYVSGLSGVKVASRMTKAEGQ